MRSNLRRRSSKRAPHEESGAHNGHQDVEILTGPQTENLDPVVSEKVHEDPQEAVPEQEMRGRDAGLWLGPSDQQ
jgi:hypothetical protein